MTSPINETHDPSLKSWIASANTGTSDFPVQNLPYAAFRRKGSQESFLSLIHIWHPDRASRHVRIAAQRGSR